MFLTLTAIALGVNASPPAKEEVKDKITETVKSSSGVVNNIVDHSFNTADSVLVWLKQGTVWTVGKVDTTVRFLAPIVNQKADTVWDIYTSQQKVWAFMWLFIWIKSLILMWYTLRYFNRHPGILIPGKADYNLLNGITAAVFSVVGTIGFFIASFNWDTIFTGLFNPRYGALHELIAEISKFFTHY